MFTACVVLTFSLFLGLLLCSCGLEPPSGVICSGLSSLFPYLQIYCISIYYRLKNMLYTFCFVELPSKLVERRKEKMYAFMLSFVTTHLPLPELFVFSCLYPLGSICEIFGNL